MKNIDFQPMPKRFMVWDKIRKSFCGSMSNDKGVFDLIELLAFFSLHANTGRPPTEFEIVQSTGLLDKDGKDILEGSIVKQTCFERPLCGKYAVKGTYIVHIVYDMGEFRITHYYPDGRFKGSSPLSESFGVWNGHKNYKSKEELEVIGHILSNPELLEDE